MVLDFKKSKNLSEETESMFLKLIPPENEEMIRKHRHLVKKLLRKNLFLLFVVDVFSSILIITTYLGSSIVWFIFGFLAFNVGSVLAYNAFNKTVRRTRAIWDLSIAAINKEYQTRIDSHYSVWAGNIIMPNINYMRGVRIIFLGSLTLFGISVLKISEIQSYSNFWGIATIELSGIFTLITATLVNIFIVSRLLYAFGRNQSVLFGNVQKIGSSHNTTSNFFGKTEYLKKESKLMNLTFWINSIHAITSAMMVFSPIISDILLKMYLPSNYDFSRSVNETLSLAFATILFYRFFHIFANKALFDLDAINVLTDLKSQLLDLFKDEENKKIRIRKKYNPENLSASKIFQNAGKILSLENFRPLLCKESVGRSYDLEISPGEVVVVVGESGIGKSTLFESIFGNREYLGNAKLGEIELNQISESKQDMEMIVSRAQTLFDKTDIRLAFSYSLAENLWTENHLFRKYISDESLEILDENRIPWIDLIWSGTTPQYKNVNLMKFLFNSKYKKYIELAKKVCEDLDSAAVKFLSENNFRNTENILSRNDFSHGESTLISVFASMLPNISPILLVDEPEQGLDSDLRSKMFDTIAQHIKTPIRYQGKEFSQRAMVIIHNFTDQERFRLDKKLGKKVKVLRIQEEGAFLV